MSAVLSAAKSLPAVPPVTLTGAWTSVGLPDEPLAVVAHDGQLWVSGANEMIAISADEGRSWTVENEKHNGEMLFALVFPAPKDIVAYGSAGVRVESRDGGQSWRRQVISPTEGFEKVVQVDGFAVANAGTDFAVSTDGGSHWKFRGLQAKTEVDDVAVLDREHALVLFQGNEKDGQEIASTEDGGVVWMGKSLSGYNLQGIRTGPGGYVLLGTGVAGGKAVEVRSPDGVDWKVSPVPVARTSCEAGGCLIPGGWVDLSGPAPVRWALPADPGEPGAVVWADAGATFCFVRDVLRCRVGRDPMAPGAHTASSGLKAKGIIPPQPKSMPDPKYPDSARSLDAEGMVVIGGMIGTDGRVHKLMVVSAPRADFARTALKLIGDQWRFSPATDKGQPVAVSADFEVNFRLYPPR